MNPKSWTTNWRGFYHEMDKRRKTQDGAYSFVEKNYNAIEDNVPEMLAFIGAFSDEHKFTEDLNLNF